jgi:hypothetical protein
LNSTVESRSRWLTWLAALALFAVNMYVCRELFRTEYLHHMESIEGAYIGISRYILAHPHDLNWFPLWYGGIPFQNTYPPLLHLMVAGVAWLFGISPALAHHAVGATFYCLGPVALMLLANALSKNLMLSFVSGLASSLVSPSAFLIPSVRTDLGSFWKARRLQSLVSNGEATHVASMTLLLFAILALHWAIENWAAENWVIEKKTAARVFVTAVLLAATVLTNWLGAFALAIACICYLMARSGDRGRAVTRMAAIGLLAYGLAAPWIPPSTILTIQRNAQFTVGNFPMGVRQLEYAGLLLLAGAGLAWLLIKIRASRCVAFGCYFLLVMAALALPFEWFHAYLVPQADRYHLEMEIGFCLIAVFGLGHLSRNAGWKLGWIAAVVVVILGVMQAKQYRRYFRWIGRPIDIHQTVEYESAQWLQKNLPGGRVYTQGSTRFWLNAFSDISQTGGGFDQGITNREISLIQFGIPYLADDGTNAAMFLRAFGVQAVMVAGANSRDSYHDWRHPNKFQGVLPELWRSGDDVIYGVPQRSPSLAHVILPADAVSRPPMNMEDVASLQKLSAALENPALPIADLVWKSPSEGTVSTVLQPGQAILFQISYHPGWKASVNGSPRPIRQDGLGFMIVEPGCSGSCEIRMVYDGGVEMRIAKWAQAASLLFGLAWVGWGWLRHQGMRKRA